MRWEKSDAAPERGIVISSTEEGGKEALIVPGTSTYIFRSSQFGSAMTLLPTWDSRWAGLASKKQKKFLFSEVCCHLFLPFIPLLIYLWGSHLLVRVKSSFEVASLALQNPLGWAP